MAKEHDSRQESVRGESIVSERRNVWLDVTNASGGGFYSVQYRGRARTTSKKEFGQFLAVSRGSVLELQTQLRIAADLGFLGRESANSLVEETEELLRLLNGLMKSLR